VLDSLVFWLDRVRKRIDNCLRVMSEKKSTLPDRLRDRARKDFGADHPDAELVNLCPTPILITATKFETFQNKDAELRKIMGRTLRFLAHVNGASLYYSSCREKALVSQYRSVLNHYLFGGQSTAVSRVIVDHSKPLCVRAGTDQIAGIGAPPRSNIQVRRLHLCLPRAKCADARTFSALRPCARALLPTLSSLIQGPASPGLHRCQQLLWEHAAGLSHAHARVCSVFSQTQSTEPVTPLDLYKHAFTSCFPPQPKKSDAVRPTPSTTAPYVLCTAECSGMHRICWLKTGRSTLNLLWTPCVMRRLSCSDATEPNPHLRRRSAEVAVHVLDLQRD
jgi:hypothetical protein